MISGLRMNFLVVTHQEFCFFWLVCSHLGLELPCTICCCYLSLDLYMCSSNSVGNLSWEHFLRTMSFEQRCVRWDIETDEMYSFVLCFCVWTLVIVCTVLSSLICDL